MYRVWLRWVALPEFARDECLSCQSQPSLFRAKESALKKEIIQQENNLCSEMYCGHLGRLNYPSRKVASCRLEACSMSQRGKAAFTSPKDLDVHLALLLG